MNVLLLGSSSVSRQKILSETHIPFKVVSQNFDESLCDYTLPFVQLVMAITQYKMDYIVLPEGKNNGDVCFILTADTMSQDSKGITHGKPIDRNDALQQIRLARNGTNVCTAFCLDRRVWRNYQWDIDQRIHRYVSAQCVFDVPDEWLDTYIDNSMALLASGAITIEEFGMQFLRSINGSYSAILGLPACELREALEKLNFFRDKM
jgi:septum formation protein